MQGEGVYNQNPQFRVRLHEKGGKHHDLPSHHSLEESLPLTSAQQAASAIPRAHFFEGSAMISLRAAVAHASRQSTGVSPHRWIMRYRIERAKGLLRNEELPLLEIALVCGFAKQSRFNRIFTTRIGMSRGRWRRMNTTSTQAGKLPEVASGCNQGRGHRLPSDGWPVPE